MSELKTLLKTTPKYVTILANNGINTAHDLLQYFPRTYEDRSTIRNLNELIFNEKGITATKGKVVSKNIFRRGSKMIYDIKFVDQAGNKGYISIFNSGFLASQLREEQRYIIVGKPSIKYSKITFSHPDVIPTEAPEEESQVASSKTQENGDLEPETGNHDEAYNAGRIYPIYPELNGIRPGWFAKKTWSLMDKVDQYFHEYLPSEFIKKFDLMGVVETIKEMHFPTDIKLQQKAIQRIFFDRLLRVQLHALLNRESYMAGRIGKKPEISERVSRVDNGLIQKILKIATETHIKYGNTLTEKQYGKIIEQKLQKENIKVEREKSLTINEDGLYVGTKYIDIIVDDKVIIELKNTPFIHKSDLKQTRSYLDLGNFAVGLLMNFGESKINIARLEKDYLKDKKDSLSGSLSDLSENPDWEIVKDIVSKLPFVLTNAQKKVIKQMIDNMHDIKPMLRLLQGDVGSGKTVVAAISAYYSFKMFKGQSVFLAPLEVLANQHYKTLAKLLLPLGLRVELLTGAVTKSAKDKIKSELKAGSIHVLIGTHAVLQEDVDFANLQFVVIDEQHKFGVRQRAFFKKFGSPHILQMSATPIPRSMALAFFGEFEVSIIDELPVGRKPISTKIVPEKEFAKLKPRILTKIGQGQRVFVVTPLIEESEKMEELKAATTEFQEFQALFPELKGKIGLLHGRMSSKEKDEVMTDFKSGKLSILVSTTVIEVGVDVPEATIMVIKSAERFGLSQLHQLRGRIGRSDMQSYCFLETKNKSGDSYQRLKAMEQTNDGFKLAELDLQTRGAGEILGTMQSGETDIPLNILTDMKFIEKIQEGAKWLLEKYPKLAGLDALKKYINEKIGDVMA